MTSQLRIGERQVGVGHPTYVIAELSANHGHHFDEAVRLVRAAKEAGADAVKLQTYTADTITLKCDRPEFLIGGGTLWDKRRLHELYAEAYTPWEWQPKLKVLAEAEGLALFSSAFDLSSVEFLEAMNVPAYKIASFELVDLPLIRRVAQTGKPMILSTGMATLDEISEAVTTARRGGAAQVALLKCTSAYPTSPDQCNLRTIPHLSQAFDCPAGLSDHTLGIAVPVAAVALGASIIEKHLCLSRTMPTPDSAFSLEPDEFREMVEAVRIAEKALGTVRYGCSPSETASLRFRRSLFVVADVKAGQAFTFDNVRSVRPGDGLPPKWLDVILGRKATMDLGRGTPLTWAHLGALGETD